MTVRYRLDSGPFTPDNLTVEVQAGDRRVVAGPSWEPDSNPAPLGGWRRSLDYEAGSPIDLHQGILSRDGWALLNDSTDVLLTDDAPGFTPRPDHGGTYQDGYLFGYGHDYAQGLADLRLLTGPTPLLPRSAFGVWFSHWWPYTSDSIKALVQDFRDHDVPLDTFSVDTDFKRMANKPGCVVFNSGTGAPPDAPCSWNGWEWEDSAFPDPEAFLAWAHDAGLQVSLNVHPSINATDPKFDETNAAAGGLPEDLACRPLQADPNPCHVFDWTDPAHLQAYFDLHAPFEEQGADLWWLDWCCDGSSADAPGLTADTWINRLYAERSRARGSRWPAFSRIGASLQEGWDGIGAAGGAGALAEHTSTIHFTGDTCGPAEMLAATAAFTAAEASIGMSYVSHDIGSFHGDNTNPCDADQFLPIPLHHSPHLPDDLYVRWVQLGTFQPLDRLHSQHGDRLPWQYSDEAERIATEFLRLREALGPYLYSLAREAHDTGLTMVRPLYLAWPEHDQAYAHPAQFLLGDDLLVATVDQLGETARTEVWIPPGSWTDWFTGEVVQGPATVVREVPLDRYPVFIRAGGVIPTQPVGPFTPPGPPPALTLTVAAGGDGQLDLYDDAGEGLGYLDGAFTRTPVATRTSASGCTAVTLGPAVGAFPGAPTTRDWTVEVRGVAPPTAVRVDGNAIGVAGEGPTWSHDPDTQVLRVSLPDTPTDVATALEVATADCAAAPSPQADPPQPQPVPLPATGGGPAAWGAILLTGLAVGWARRRRSFAGR